MMSIVRRVLVLLLLVCAVFAATRLLIRALPGDPLEMILAETGTTVPPETLREELRLDQPFTVAVLHDLGAAMRGNFGTSILTRQPVSPLLAARTIQTLQLSGLTLLLALPFSIVFGLAAANRPGSWIDRSCSAFGALCAAFPTPWTGPLLLLAFAVWLPIFPAGNSIFLPALTLAITFSGAWSRLIRARVRESLQVGFTTSARARGLPEWLVLVKYGLIPVSGPLLSYFGAQLGHLLTGAFVTEMIFDWKGLGQLLISSILRRDYPVVEAGAFAAAALCLLGTWSGDWLGSRVRPWNR